jgi:CRP-like cAMP-binding protein
MASKYEGPTQFPEVPAFSPAIDSSLSSLHLPHHKACPSGTRFITQGEAPAYVSLIRSGIVKLTHTTPDGRELMIGLRSEGWWICASAAIAKVQNLVTITAVTDCSVSSLFVADFRTAIFSDATLIEQYVTVQCRELLTMQQYIIRQGASAAVRLRSFHEEEKSSAWKTVDPKFALRQSEVASLLAITPEHLSRIKAHSTQEKKNETS